MVSLVGKPNYNEAISLSQIRGAEVIHKFGRNASVGTSFVPVCFGGLYRTPTPTNATALRVKAGDANDTAAGTGAQAVTIEGILADGSFATEVLVTAGASASADSANSYIRLLRAYVSASGTYGTQSVGSHAADIVIENAAGTEDWATIDSTGYPRAQTEIGAYTVPTGKIALIYPEEITVDTSKTTDLVFFQRGSILDETTPFSAIRAVFSLIGLKETGIRTKKAPYYFDENTDIGYLAKVSATTSSVDIGFQIHQFTK